MTETHDDDLQPYGYKAPALPAYTAYALNHSFMWMIPFWITEFIIYCCKSRLIQNGVSSGDWAILFLWLIGQICSNYLAILSIKQVQCEPLSPFWFFILIDIVTIFFTIYFAAISNTILLLEIITCVVTIIIQCMLFIGTIISFFIQIKPTKPKAM